jgi:divalent metal cation (Fe/Co/Zn/Cd) transporter
MSTTERRPGLLRLTPAAARGELRLNGQPPNLDPAERQRLVRRARLLAWGGNAWHTVEFGIAVGAGIAAGSVALVGFGADSLIEALAGFIILWRFAERRSHSEQAERRAQQLVAASYAVLVAYILVEALRTLFGGQHPGASWIGVRQAA